MDELQGQSTPVSVLLVDVRISSSLPATFTFSTKSILEPIPVTRNTPQTPQQYPQTPGNPFLHLVACHCKFIFPRGPLFSALLRSLRLPFQIYQLPRKLPNDNEASPLGRQLHPYSRQESRLESLLSTATLHP